MTEIQLVVFDMEGTLTTDPTVWEIMHAKNGTWESHGSPYWEQFKAGALGYDEFARKDVAAWKGASVAMLDEAVAEVPLMPGCAELLAMLAKKGVQSVIISNGLERLGLRLAREFGIDRVEANREIVEAGMLTGGIDLRVPFDRKDDVLQRVAREMATPLGNVLAVGDGIADMRMFDLSGLSVAFMAENQQVRAAADHVIDDADLRKIVPAVF